MSSDQVTGQSQRVSWLRGIRPLIWWVILVIVFTAYHQHQVWNARTRLSFSPVMNGNSVSFEARATLDGEAFLSGEHAPLGSHKLVITHPLADTFSTNIFIWYGDNNLGGVPLNRQMGTLAISADPPASILTVQGVEFSRQLTNSGGLTSSVPTGRYTIDAVYPFSRESSAVDVKAVWPGSKTIAPRFGAMRIEANQTNASFELRSASGRLLRSGMVPATVTELPESRYDVAARYHGDEQSKSLTIKADETNIVRFEFLYGATVLTTEPDGASVFNSDGEQKGVTPLTLSELKPGHWEFTFRKKGYETVTAAMDVAANETNQFQTNLVSHAYSQNVAAARQYLDSGNFDQAVNAAFQALAVKPNDSVADALMQEATGQGHLRDAERLMMRSNYVAADAEILSALKLLPGNLRALQLQDELKQREKQQADADRRERAARPQRAFDSTAAAMRFEGQSLAVRKMTAKMPVADVEKALQKAFREDSPQFTVTPVSIPIPESFGFLAWQTYLGGGRRCAIAGAQTGDNETELIFRVVEYRGTYAVNVQGLFNAQATTTYVALDPAVRGDMTEGERARLQEGLRTVTERIERAIGQPVGK